MTAESRAADAVHARPVAGDVTRWAVDRQLPGLRRGLQVTLGVIWLLDAALQYQPFMFGKGFVTKILTPAQAGNPVAVAAVPLAAGHLIGSTQPAANAIFATIQLVLGLALLWRPTVKAGLAGSVVWGLSVWWLGEGLGGMLMAMTGADRMFFGAPGAAVLYAFLAALIWPTAADMPRHDRGGGERRGGRVSVADEGLLGRYGARFGWFMVWLSSAYLALQPANRASGALRQAIAGLAAGEPRWLAGLDHQAAAAAGTQGLLTAVVIAVIAVVVGYGVFVPAATRPALVLAVLFSLAIWVVGENFGGILTGRGTDPNTGPLLVLLVVALWPLAGSSRDDRPASAVIITTTTTHQLHRDPVATLWAVTAGCWALVVGLLVIGRMNVTGHDTTFLDMVGGALPVPGRLAAFGGAWLVMIGAMMLPATVPMVRMFTVVSAHERHPAPARAVFHGAYLLVWLAWAFIALAGDLGVHELVVHLGWLHARQGLVLAGVLGLAGAFQFSPLKWNCLTKCRDPRAFLFARYRSGIGGAWTVGVQHGVSCLGCCWALMLVMFATGIGSLLWMLGLTAVMVAEKTMRWGRRLVAPVGVGLLLAAFVLAALAIGHSQ